MKEITAQQNKTLALITEAAIFVKEGTVDIFVKARDKAGPLIPLTRVPSGKWLFSIENANHQEVQLLAKLSKDAVLQVHDSIQLCLDDKLLSPNAIKSFFKSVSENTAFDEFKESLSSDEISLQDFHKTYGQWQTYLPQVIENRQLEFGTKLKTLEKDIDYSQSSTDHTLDSATHYHQKIKSVSAESRKNELTMCFSIACKTMGIYNKPVFDYDREFKYQSDELEYIAQANNINVRRFKLDANWCDTMQSTMIAFRKDNNKPVILISKLKGYYLVDPVTLQKTKITSKNADIIIDQAYVLYPSFEKDSVTLRNFSKLIIKNSGVSIFIIITAFIFISLLSLVNPIITSYIVDIAIPNAEIGFIFEMLLVILSVTLSIGLFTYLKEILIINLELRANINAQAAVFDRLLKQPVHFFDRFNTGDLANRTLSVDSIIKLLTSVNINGILTFAFSFFSLLLMLYYQWLLTVVVVIVTTLAILLFYLLALIQLKYIQAASNELGDSFGFMFQAITGISKIKLAAKQVFATERWARIFAKYRNHLYRTYYLGAWRTNLFQLVQLTCLIFIFAIVNWHYKGTINLGDYIAFNSAFVQFYYGLLTFSISATNSLPAIIFYRRLKPILENKPEYKSQFDRGMTLKGNINLSHLYFRYANNSPMIVDDLSLEVKAGQFVALVGYSGAGKSTLLKLLMGFESPSMGSISYDNRELKTLNIKELRRKIGVVLQDGALMPGSILENIIGQSTQLNEQDAWDAAKLAAIDKDIASMPMGMHTVVSEGMGTISGGQKQRILIARALVRKPKILFLDEATSALDNETQAIVSKNIDEAEITRVVIAHRLSTIMHADKICVLKDGKIIEQGTYQQLLDKKAFFYELAQNQIP